MFKSLKEFINSKFAEEKQTSLPEDKIQLATAVLMFEVIKSDNQVDNVEIERLHQLLENEFDLQKEDLLNLVELAKQTSEESISIQGFTRTVCDNWNNQQRMQLLVNLWIVAFADNKIDTHERHIIRKIANLLYLNDKEIIQARELAKQNR